MPIDSTPTTPTTLLDAINTLLQGIRVASIDSLLQINRNEDAAAAKTTLDNVARETLMVGYEFNTERGVKLDPEAVSGEVFLPNNWLRVKAARCYANKSVVPRGNRMYDPKLRSFAIGATVELDLVVSLAFEEMPPSARAYVTAVAARRFCVPRLPDGATFRYTEEMVESALAVMEQDDTDLVDTGLKGTSSHFGAMGRR